MNIVVCCSMTQLSEAKQIQEMVARANQTSTTTSLVMVPLPKSEKGSLTDHRKAYYNTISDADLIIILTKHDGTIGDSVSHELAFTKYLGKPYLIVEMKWIAITKEDLKEREEDSVISDAAKEKIEELSNKIKKLEAEGRVEDYFRSNTMGLGFTDFKAPVWPPKPMHCPCDKDAD